MQTKNVLQRNTVKSVIMYDWKELKIELMSYVIQ